MNHSFTIRSSTTLKSIGLPSSAGVIPRLSIDLSSTSFVPRLGFLGSYGTSSAESKRGSIGVAIYATRLPSGLKRTSPRIHPYGLPSIPVSYTHLRAHETGRNLVCRLLL